MAFPSSYTLPTSIDYTTRFTDRLDRIVRQKMTCMSSINKSTLLTSRDFDNNRKVAINAWSFPAVNTYDGSSTREAYGAEQEVKAEQEEFELTKTASCNHVFQGLKAREYPFYRVDAFMDEWMRVRLIPHLDTQFYTTIGAIATSKSRKTTGTLTGNVFYYAVLTAKRKLQEDEVEGQNMTLYVTPEFYEGLKKDSNFANSASDLALRNIIFGGYPGVRFQGMFDGQVDGVKMKIVEPQRMPTGQYFMLVADDIVSFPRKVNNFTIAQGAQEFYGWRAYGMTLYDVLVPDNQKVKLWTNSKT